MSEVIQIREDTWRIEDGGVRFFVLTGKERAIMIDSGMNTPNAKEIAESITKLPLTLLNTHTDIDHVSGNAAFESVMMDQTMIIRTTLSKWVVCSDLSFLLRIFYKSKGRDSILPLLFITTVSLFWIIV